MNRTHFYDFIVKLIALIVPMLILVSIPFFEERGVLMLIISLVTGVLAYITFLRTLGSYLYCRLTLKMKVDFVQAQKLNAALAPNPFTGNRKWVPMLEIKHIADNEEKYKMALQFTTNHGIRVKQERKQAAVDYKNSSTRNKIFTWALSIFAVLSFLSSFFNVPPASFVIKLYCHVFNEDRYPVILMGLIPIFVVIIIYFLIIKIIQAIKPKQVGETKSEEYYTE